MAKELMSQNELAEKLAKKHDISVEDAKKFVEAFFNNITKDLKKEDELRLAGFGTFKKTWIEKGEGINPASGEKIEIPAHYRLKFTASAPVNEQFNKKYAGLKPKLIKEKNNAVKETKAVESQDEDENDDENEGNKKETGKIIGLCVAILLLLILLIVLLARGCSSDRKEGRDVEVTASEAAAAQEAEARAAEEAARAEAESRAAEEAARAAAVHVDPVVTKPAPEFTYKQYTVPSGSNYHEIAINEYKNRHLWPCVYNANKDSSPDPDVLKSGVKIQVPQIKSVTEDAENIKAAMLEAYKAYKERGKKRLGAGVLTSAEVVYPGFIDANADKIDSEYAQYAKDIYKRNYR